MAYCRWSEDSDVYLYCTGIDIDDPGPPTWVCADCGMRPPGSHSQNDSTVEMHTREAVLEHLLEHRAAGHKVPEDALDRIREEIAAATGATSEPSL